MTPTNEPVAVNGLLSVIAAVITPLLAKRGIDANGAQAIFSAVGALITAELSVWAIYRARSQVTPTAAPKTDLGVPLVPVQPTPAAPAAPPAPPAG